MSDPSTRPRILVVAGPTASGKTGSALTLARALGGELIGADSVQVYRGFDVGSAKPTAEELCGTPHHLIDLLEPEEGIDAAGYAAMADEVIGEVASRGALPIVVGGTGLWLRALVRGLVDVPPVDPTLRAGLEAEADAVGSAVLHERLARVDPRAAGAIHPNDRLRIVRALEVYEQTGAPLGELRAAHALGAPRHDALFVVLDREPRTLAARIEERTRAMIDAGLVEEVRSLLARHGPDVRAFRSVGYRQVLEHVRDEVPLDEAMRRMNKATRVYGRRQRTWFRGEPGVHLWTTDDDIVGGDARREVEAWLRGSDQP